MLINLRGDEPHFARPPRHGRGPKSQSGDTCPGGSDLALVVDIDEMNLRAAETGWGAALRDRRQAARRTRLQGPGSESRTGRNRSHCD